MPPKPEPLVEEAPATGGKSPRVSPILTRGGLAVALGLSVAYLAFVMLHAVDIPQADEWGSVLPFVHQAIHHHLPFSALWVQHDNESHLFIPNLIFIADGLWWHYDIKMLIALSALLQISSLFVLLALLHKYLRNSITSVTALAFGCVWLGLAGIDNALWGYQLQIYLTVFFFVVLLYCLERSNGDRKGRLFFSLAVVCALAASLSTIQGLMVWPIGFLVLVWMSGGITEHWQRLTVWCGVAAITVVTYLIGYNQDEASAGCIIGKNICSATYGIGHLGATIPYLLALLGNVDPANDTVLFAARDIHQLVYQLLGLLLFVASLVCCIPAWRRRREPASWLPISLILAGLMWDVTIALGRVSQGIGSALGSHYSTPQVLVLCGVVASFFSWLGVHESGRTETAKMLFGASLAVIVGVATLVGVQNANRDVASASELARVLVNLDRVPANSRPCLIDVLVDYGIGSPKQDAMTFSFPLRLLSEDRLSSFSPSEYNALRREGMPDVYGCPD